MRSYADVAGRSGRPQRPATNGRSSAPAPAAPEPAAPGKETPNMYADMAAMLAGAGVSAARDDPVVQDRYTFALFSLVGQRVQVWVADGSVYEGILHTATFDNPAGLGVVLSMATRKRGDGPQLAHRNRIVIQPQDFVQMVASEAEFDDANEVRGGPVRGFATDTAISGNRGAPARRRLEKADAWVSGSDTAGGLEEDERGRRMRAGKWDQFEANERLFQVQSSFDENQYTTPLNISSYTRQERERAARLAREIERKARGMKDSMTEEERFSSVARSRPRAGGNNVPPRQVRPVRTRSDGTGGGSTYVPPHRRAEGEASPVAASRVKSDAGPDATREHAADAPVAAVRGQRVNNVELNEATRRRQTEELRDFASNSRRGHAASDSAPEAARSAAGPEDKSNPEEVPETPAATAAPTAATPAAAAAPAPASAPAASGPAASEAATATADSSAAPAASAPLKSKLRADVKEFVPRMRQPAQQSMPMHMTPVTAGMGVMVPPAQARVMPAGAMFPMGPPNAYMMAQMRHAIPPGVPVQRPMMANQFPQQRFMVGAPAAWNGPPPQMMGPQAMAGAPRGMPVAFGGAPMPMQMGGAPHAMPASNQMLPGSPRSHARRNKGGKDGGKAHRGAPRGAPRGPPRGPPHGAVPAGSPPRGQQAHNMGPRGALPRGYPGQRMPMQMQGQVHPQHVLPGAPPHPPQQRR